MSSRTRLFSFVYFALVLLTVFAFNAPFAYSQSSTDSASMTTDTSGKAKDLENQIKEYQQKISDLQGQANTLSSQLKVMDSQIKLTELRINSTEGQITELSNDIQIITNKVASFEKSINNLMQVLMKRIVASYMQGAVQPYQIFLESDSVSDIIVKSEYLRIVKENDQKLLVNIIQAKNDYQNQKSIFEDKKKKVEALHKQLEAYTTQLDQQKKGKETLLTLTKNSEKEYQKRLTDALKELQQIQKAAKVLISTEARHVNRGDPIGLMGNTGYSFGAHLHFGIYNISSLDQYNYYSNYEDPKNYLEAQTVSWDTGCGGDPVGKTNTGSGLFAWPMATDNLFIAQNAGITCYSNIYYKGKPHPAFDMYNNSNVVVKAVEEGQAYFCKNCTGDGANGVFIFHPNGKMSLYWHLQ